jgi:hypothetical protein
MSDIPLKNNKPKDPLYFKKYYENKIKSVNYYCELCKIETLITHKSRHLKTKKHKENESKNKQSNYLEYDFEKYNELD